LTSSSYKIKTYWNVFIKCGAADTLTSDTLTAGGTLLVAQLVEALRYKPEGRGYDSRWCQWIFSFT